MLSPSPPCGRVSTLTVMFGFLAWNASASAFAGVSDCSELSTRYDRETLPFLSPPLSLVSPKPPHAASASVAISSASRDPDLPMVICDLLLRAGQARGVPLAAPP